MNVAEAITFTAAQPEYRSAISTLVDTLGITRYAAARLVVVAILNGYPMVHESDARCAFGKGTDPCDCCDDFEVN